MTKETFDSLLPEPQKLLDAAKKEKPTFNFAEASSQYEPSGHDIADGTKFPDKLVETSSGTSTVPITRLSLPLQKKIVFYAAAFLCGNPVKILGTTKSEVENNLLQVVRKTMDDNKMQYKNMQLAELMMSETEVAEVWYTEELESDSEYWAGTPNEGIRFRLRVKVLANSKGDELYPIFNEMGDMIAFIRTYSIPDGDKKIDMMELYTDTFIKHFQKGNSEYEEVKSAPNILKKIPVIYYSQPDTEWADVQTLIDRFEKSISGHGDTNDYFGSPMIKVTGEVKGFAKKGEQGKVIEMDNGADADYLTWDQSPESIKLEQNNLRSLIFDMTDTPDISFTQMSKLGTFSGFAIKLLFMSAHLKAAKKEQIFGEGVQRRINLIKIAMTKLNTKLEKAVTLNIHPEFEYYLPKDTETEVAVLVSAKEGGILSTETAIERNPLVSDPKEEKNRIQTETDQANSDPNALDNLNNQ